VEAVLLSFLGGIMGVLAGWFFSYAVSALTPLPARVTLWSVGVALALGAATGIIFGVYPAARAARLDPITALRSE
jgi:putative ABC transport system permease protein